MAIETLNRNDIAKELHVDAAKIPSMILNGTLPVGCAYDNGVTTRAVIVKRRWDIWRNGRDLEVQRVPDLKQEFLESLTGDHVKITRDDVAKELGVSGETVTTMILNGTLPIGCAYNGGVKTRTIVIRRRWELWAAGRDLELRRDLRGGLFSNFRAASQS